MKIILLSLTLATLALTVRAQDTQRPTPWDIKPPAPDNQVPGRFQLYTGSDGTLYRLDTCTGQTWEMVKQNMDTSSVKNVRLEGWEEITESFDYDLVYYSTNKFTQPFTPSLKNSSK